MAMTEPALTVVETAFAKINLALHVRSRRADGYHLIESLFAFVDAGDRIEAKAAPDLRLRLEGRFSAELGEGEDNLVLRAARAMQRYFGVDAGADIVLNKHLPVAAGLGGGSADAAAVARVLNRLWNVGADEAALVAAIGGLGADIPVCVASRTVVGRGIGDEMTPWPDAAALTGRPVLLVNPGRPCPTGPVFRQWDGMDRGPLGDAMAGWRNDLEPGALVLVPEIGAVLEVLNDVAGAGLVGMSGSGATCFALFDEEEGRDAAQQRIARMRPDWWTLTGLLR